MTLFEQMLLAFVTACLPLFGGLLLFFLTELVVKPYHAYKSTLAATFKLIFHANYLASTMPIPNPAGQPADPPKVDSFTEKKLEASNACREIAARLRAALVACPFPKFFHWVGLIHSPKDIDEAAGLLIFAANVSLDPEKEPDAISQTLAAVQTKLGIPIAEPSEHNSGQDRSSGGSDRE